jgi:hypothetical protein
MLDPQLIYVRKEHMLDDVRLAQPAWLICDDKLHALDSRTAAGYAAFITINLSVMALPPICLHCLKPEND